MLIQLEKGSKIVFMGDSITDCYRGQPQGEGLYGYGNSYVGLIDGLLKAFCPTWPLRVVNMGTGGDTVKDLHNRWKRDCLDLKPDYVSVMIGVNDLWRQFDFPLVTDRHVLPEDYRSMYAGLIEQTLPQVRGMFLMTPFVLEPNQSEPFRQQLGVYAQITKELADQYRLPCLDIQARFDAYMEHVHPMSIGAAGDRIHPNMNGHFIIARAFLEEIGADIFR